MKHKPDISNDGRDAFNETRASSNANGGSFSQILQDIVNHVTEIIRSEVRLLRAEVRQDLTQVAKANVFL